MRIPGAGLSWSKRDGKPQVPRKHFGNLRVGHSQSSLQLRCSMDPSYPEFAQAQAYMVLFVWGPILPVTCLCALPTAAQEKAPFCPHP